MATNQTAKIYIGPDVPGTLLQRYTVFRGDFHESVERLCVQFPAIKRLIVGVEEMAEREQKLADKTSVEAHSFAEVINHIKGVIKS
tara:strand:- start:11763 stop:12020 length:258 start_codon:yes stop_codon:yes gene_type:complete